ncbi:hypothetical protein [Tunicatimonas pelagia]|uniref:hypothetical protein n=1 Tax=Tunicatimonas pelagia TaxID=931531 RepID=UPI002665FD30|nr:hypothetical protein [Tunicatimonas pelagia]WKN42067.1 hypothetical protein P0M28_23810 [Tunicatimonas pelagia]
MSWVREKYRSLYQSLNFERRGLFALVHSEWGDRNTLYPASSIHITPSFFFSRVTYLDKSAVAAKFFQDQQAVQRLVNQEKVYRKEASINFLHQDFQKEMLLPNHDFNLLISLFGGNLIQQFAGCLIPNGLILTCNRFSGQQQVAEIRYTHLATIQYRRGKYIIVESSTTPRHSNKDFIRNSRRQWQFKDNEQYYIYQKSDNKHRG